jgi:preprotein translocase subunit Sec63
MDEVLKSYQVLGLKAGCSEAELEEAYQDRADAWNPENFSGNEKLRLNAQEKLKHITAAYELLRTRLSATAVTTTAELATPAPAGNRLTLWALVVVLALLLLGAALLFLFGTEQ